MYPSLATTNRTIADRRGGIIGHSIGAYLGYSVMGDAFRDRLIQGLASANGVELSLYAIGGSAISRTLGLAAWNADGALEGASYVDDTGGAPAQGSALIQNPPQGVTPGFLYQMAQRGAGNGLDFLIGAWGYRDQQAMDGQYAGITPAQAVAKYRDAVAFMLSELRASTGFSSTGKVLPMMPGRYLVPTNSLGLDLLRQEFLRLLATDANVFKACELWDYAIGDAVHPSRAAQRILGIRAADAVLKYVYGITAISGVPICEGPSIVSIGLQDSTHVQINLTGNGETIAYPASNVVPSSFAFAAPSVDLMAAYNDASPPPVLFPTGWSRSGDTITLTLPSPVSGGSVQTLFPYNDGAGFNALGVIRGATSGKPLQSWYRG